MFTQGVSSTDDSAIDLLFGDKTPGADDLLGGKKPEDKKPVEDQKQQQTINPGDNIPASTDPVVEVPEEGVDQLFPEGDLKGDGSDKKPEDKKKTAPKLPDTQEINYEAIYRDMVDEGIWQEVEVPEGREWDKKLFLEIQGVQTKSQYEDLLDRTGTYGKAIIEYEQNGGNPKELLGLFREQRDVQEFDIKEPDGQEEFLRAYLESQGNSERSIERTLTALKEQGGDALKEEAEEKKELWDSQYREQIEATQKEQALLYKQMEDVQKNFQKTITNTLHADPEETPKGRRELEAYMLAYNQNFQGRQVSQFYLDMAEVQKDPKNYIELARFVKGLKTGEYKKKVEDKVKKEASASSYLKIKNGAALKTSTSGNPDMGDKGSSFVTLLKK